jgi:cellulose biosynthesis protein BcsQ
VDESPAVSDARSVLMERPPGKGRSRTIYLGPVSVMSGSRQFWKALDARLDALALCDGKRGHSVLKTILKPLQRDFDICLIDFPAHETGPITKNGLRAASWWIFPCVPDRSGSRDIEGPVEAFREACRGTKHRPQALGTLLSICQSATTREYKQTYNSLHQLGEDGYIPPIFNSKMLFWPAAREALDDTRWDHRTTLKKKYANDPLYKAGRGLAKEVLSRLDLPAEETRLDLGLLRGLNKYVRKLFVGARVK